METKGTFLGVLVFRWHYRTRPDCGAAEPFSKGRLGEGGMQGRTPRKMPFEDRAFDFIPQGPAAE